MGLELDPNHSVPSNATHSNISLLSEVNVETRFRRLAEQWKNESEFLSSASKMAMIQSYQQIIGIGPAAIPLILRELEKEVDHWFWALKAISAQDPVSESERGDMKKMARAWLDWGRAQGIQW